MVWERVRASAQGRYWELLQEVTELPRQERVYERNREAIWLRLTHGDR